VPNKLKMIKDCKIACKNQEMEAETENNDYYIYSDKKAVFMRNQVNYKKVF
jgi:hypothetical protein